MRKLKLCPTIMALVFALSGPAIAGNTAQQTISFVSTQINQLMVSGSEIQLYVTTATAGQHPDEVSGSPGTYSITTNGSNKRITGVLDADMPAYTTLKINLSAPPGALTHGDVVLSATAADLVTSISNIAAEGLPITYKFSARVEFGAWTGDRTVTLTLTD